MQSHRLTESWDGTLPLPRTREVTGESCLEQRKCRVLPQRVFGGSQKIEDSIDSRNGGN